MSDFLVWYFNLSAWGAIEFFFKSLLLMVLFAIPVVIGWCVIKRVSGSPKAATPQFTTHSGRELAAAKQVEQEDDD